MKNTQTKKDITRLKNLLRLYRDHIITNKAMKNNNYDVILEVDRAIYCLIEGL